VALGPYEAQSLATRHICLQTGAGTTPRGESVRRCRTNNDNASRGGSARGRAAAGVVADLSHARWRECNAHGPLTHGMTRAASAPTLRRELCRRSQLCSRNIDNEPVLLPRDSGGPITPERAYRELRERLALLQFLISKRDLLVAARALRARRLSRERQPRLRRGSGGLGRRLRWPREHAITCKVWLPDSVGSLRSGPARASSGRRAHLDRGVVVEAHGVLGYGSGSDPVVSPG
jgi:ribosomal protein L40E